MSTHDAERDPSGKRRDEVDEDVGGSPRPDEPERPPDGEIPREPAEDELDPEAGENPS